jgi:hypothetical protein
VEKLIVFFVIAVISIVLKSGGQQNNKQSSTKRPVNISSNRNQQSLDNDRYQGQYNANQRAKSVNTVRSGNTHKVKIQSEKQGANINRVDSSYQENGTNNSENQNSEYYSEEYMQREAFVNANNNATKSSNVEVNENDENTAIDITENLQRSIMITEILGPPRAIKKSIR